MSEERKLEVLDRLISKVKVEMSEAEVRVGGVVYELYTGIGDIEPYEIIRVGLDEELELRIRDEVILLQDTLEYLEDERSKLEKEEVRISGEDNRERILYITEEWR